MIRYEDIASAIQVRHLQVELEEAMTLEPGDDARQAAASLAERGFDQAPVTENGRIVGLFWSERAHDRGSRVIDALDTVAIENLVSADAPVSHALAWLADARCLFVLDGRRISGFVTEADLNKQPARVYFYLLVASLETALAQLLRRWTGGDEERVVAALPTGIRRRVLAARSESRADDVDADIIAFLLFSDILRVIGRIPSLLELLGARSTSAWENRTGALVGLRNAVMHPTKELLGRERPLVRLVEHDSLLRELLGRLDEAAAVR